MDAAVRSNVDKRSFTRCKTPLVRGFVLTGDFRFINSGDANGASAGDANPNGGDAIPSDDDASPNDVHASAPVRA